MNDLRVLIADDDMGMRTIMRKIVERVEDFVLVAEAGDGKTALELVEKLKPDVVFLDVEMPEMTGVECARAIQDLDPNVVIIFATAHDHYMGDAFEVYAFDYLIKPFGIMTLVSRIKAVLRRCNKQEDSSTLSAHGITMDVENHEVRVFGEDVELTKKEFAILQLFLQNPGKVFNRETLMHEVWGEEFVGESRTVDMHIKTLRQKLGDAAASIKTVVGIGYRMEVVG